MLGGSRPVQELKPGYRSIETPLQQLGTHLNIVVWIKRIQDVDLGPVWPERSYFEDVLMAFTWAVEPVEGVDIELPYGRLYCDW